MKTLILCCLLMGSQLVGAQKSDLEIMRQKQREITGLITAIHERRHTLEVIKTKLEQQQSLVFHELMNQALAQQCPNYEIAIKQPEIRYKLKLLHTAEAFYQPLKKHIDQLNHARTKLEYLAQRAEDAVKLLEIVSSMDTRQLITQIDQTLAEISLLIDGTLTKPPEFDEKIHIRLWQELINHIKNRRPCG